MDTTGNDDEDVPYEADNDEYRGELSINKSMRGNPYNGPLLPRHVFTQMCKKGKDSWKLIGTKDRQVIMDSLSGSSKGSSPTNSGGSTGSSFSDRQYWET